MNLAMPARFAVGALPVAAFLLALVWLDSYKLVRGRQVLAMLAAGATAALLSLALNPLGFRWGDAYAWLGAPVVEEGLKAIIVVEAVRRARIGFPVDAAICGCAVGAGFACLENLWYASEAAAAPPHVFVLRGFGTAVLHAGATALVAVLARRARRLAAGTAAGLALAIAVHGFYNSGLLAPEVAAALVMATVPALFAFVFARSEASLRRWLGDGLDQEMERLAMISSGHFLDTPAGAYLKSLRAHFPPTVVADMFCLLRISLELSMRAKGELLKREAGFRPVTDAAIRARLVEFNYLQKAVGLTGRMALAPLLAGGHRQVWQLFLLDRHAAPSREAV